MSLAEALDRAERETVGIRLYETAMALAKVARDHARLSGLGDGYIAAILSYAAGFAIAEQAPNGAVLAQTIGVAQASLDAAARGRFNDRIDERKLIGSMAHVGGEDQRRRQA